MCRLDDEARLRSSASVLRVKAFSTSESNAKVIPENTSSAECFTPGFEGWSLADCEVGWVVKVGVGGGEVDPEGRGWAGVRRVEAESQVGSCGGVVSRADSFGAKIEGLSRESPSLGIKLFSEEGSSDPFETDSKY